MANKPTIDCFIEELPDGKTAFRYVEDFFSGALHLHWANPMEAISGRIRNQLHDDTLVYRCPHCHGKLFLTGEAQPKEDGKRHFRLHFKHKSGQQSPVCPFRPDKSKTKAEAERDGHANKEQSPIHYKIKYFVADTLNKEYPDAQIDIEKRITTSNGSPRRPDINVKFPLNSTFMSGKEVDFEIQVSYILIARVKERKEAHKHDGRPVLWIFDRYEEALFQNDIIERNELNAFVLDNEARLRSIREGKLYLHVYFPTFELVDDKVVKLPLSDEIVCLDSIQFDEESCELFYKRSKSQREELEAQALKLQAHKQNEHEQLKREARRREIVEKEQADKIRIQAEEKRLRAQLQDEHWEKCKQFETAVDGFVEFDDDNINIYDIANFALTSHESMDYLLRKFQDIVQYHNDSSKKFGIALSIMSRLDSSRVKELGFDLWPIMNNIIYGWVNSEDDNQSSLFSIKALVNLAPRHGVEIINTICSSQNYTGCFSDSQWAKEKIESFVKKYVKEENGTLINTAPKDDEHQTRDLFEAMTKLMMLGKIWLSGINNKAELAALYLKHHEFFLSLQSLKQGFVSYGKFDNFLQLANNVTHMKRGFYVAYLSRFIKIADYYHRNLKSHRNKILTMLESKKVSQPTDLDTLICLLIFDIE